MGRTLRQAEPPVNRGMGTGARQCRATFLQGIGLHADARESVGSLPDLVPAMKAKSLWILAMAALLAASCEKKEEPSESAAKPKAIKPVASKHRPASGSPSPGLSAQLPEAGESSAGLAMQSEAPVSPAAETQAQAHASPAPAAPVQAPMTTEEANAWREARRNEQREQRVARVSEQMTARFKERDANGDGVLQQSEVSERMQRGFSRADTNGDGSLDAAEQEAMIQSMSERAGDGDGRDRRGGRGPGRGR